MRWMILLIILCLSVGCVSTKQVKSETGDMAHSIECRGASSWADCYAKAGQICPHGYNIIAKEAERKGRREIKTLIIECK